MKYLPTDINTFENMIKDNYVYVDKTEHIYNLFSYGSRYYFLSRPRRFGKSLLISTLKNLFLGNKELFKDLWIHNSNYNWEKFPVIHLDFSLIEHNNDNEFENALSRNLDTIAKEYNIDLSNFSNFNSKFIELIQKLSLINKVVLLIDEYDKPILDNLKNIKIAEEIRSTLKTFYDIVKGSDAYLRAIFITGVTQFTKTSVFSGINNLNDISLKKDAATLLGYTINEINYYFKEHIKEFSDEKKISKEEILNTMQQWYNGYRFSHIPDKVYNPYSVLYYLKDKETRNYWFKSGTPTFLIKLVKDQYNSLSNIGNSQISDESLGQFEIDNIPLIPVLFQTGYLTITDYNNQTRRYTLNYPNLEVEESMTKFLVTVLSNNPQSNVDTIINSIRKDLESKNIANFCKSLKILFAKIPYTLLTDKESYYHSLFQFLMNLLSIESQSEILTNTGRIDLVIIMKEIIYLFELKFNSNADIALDQINDKKYYERFLDYKKEIILVGLTFNQGKDSLEILCKSENLN